MSAVAGAVKVSQVGADRRPSISLWKKSIAWIRNWRSCVRARRQLEALSDRQLRDIGMTRLEVDRHAMRPFRPLIQHAQPHPAHAVKSADV